MIAEFKGINQGVVGKKLPADTTLNNMKKPELIKLLHVAQHNYEVLNGFYTEAVNVNIGKLNSFTEEHDKEIRNKAIDEFVKTLKSKFDSTFSENRINDVSPISWDAWVDAYNAFNDDIDETAEQMKENENEKNVKC